MGILVRNATTLRIPGKMVQLAMLTALLVILSSPTKWGSWPVDQAQMVSSIGVSQ
jgi:hypothetical protein